MFTIIRCSLLKGIFSSLSYDIFLLAYLMYSSMFVWLIIYLCIVLSLMHLDDILFGSFWVINGSSHFGGVICFVHLSFFKMCVHGYHHLVLILQDYLVTMWCVKLMRNSNSKWPLIISNRIFNCLLLKRNEYHIMGE